MEPFLSLLQASPEYRTMRELLAENRCCAASGMTPTVRAHYAAALNRDLQRPVLMVCPDNEAALQLQAELRSMTGEEPAVLPSRDLTLYDAGAVSREWEQKRLRVLYGMLTGAYRFVTASFQALSCRTLPPQQLKQAAVQLKVGMQAEPEKVCEGLTALGYSRCSLVEGPGQYALRGGILDIFSPSSELPVRAEFFGDEIDTMGYFDPLTQRRTENADELLLLPVAEALPGLHPEGTAHFAKLLSKELEKQERKKTPNEALLKTLRRDLERAENGLSFAAWDRYLELLYPEYACGADYLQENAIVVICDHGGIRSAAKAYEDDLHLGITSLVEAGTLDGGLCRFSCGWEEFCERLQAHGTVFMDSFLGAKYPEALKPKELLTVQAKQLPAFGGNLETLVSDLEHYRANGYAAVVLCGSRHRAELLEEMLRDKKLSCRTAVPFRELPGGGELLLTDGSIGAGIEYPELKVAFLTEGQASGSRSGRKVHPAAKKATNRQKLISFTDLTPGDLIVHEYHGIGRYMGMEQLRVDNVVKDYVKISYQGTDVLYVPATQMDLISKYIGGGEDAPVRLNKLGTDNWQKTKARARKAVKDLAEGLIKLYAERKRIPGYSFSPDSPWQREFEESFEYAETDDQLRCTEEIKHDMERHQPMDRLLCGDVGFGKTEVALRAAMKAILDGKQVAILVPTTVLAQQHYVTAVRRFRGFPVNIDVLSRFRTATQQKNTLTALAAGKLDLIIGTHKLLQKSVVFKDLGLLIVDEEQRFGVSHKERLKELSKGVDVLTLSATPIPRTLNMALSGIRDMSTIEEPPGDRYPVQTFVMEHAEPILRDAMVRELERGGQVYYLYNRVESIEQKAAAIKKQIPDAEIAVAHGKMNEEQLSDVMERMAAGEIQILVCTTIIETGIDIPNVNTLIIENADRMGLSQLHQIRGRVGRSSRHAFAYLTFRPGKALSEVAEKRLTAIRDFAEFGSGFKIAMRDLEIRGAGNLLGAEQSGHMMSVGYDMYLQLLEEAVLEEQGEKPAEENCAADLTVNANIPKQYVPSGEQRMDLYRRIAAIRSKEDADDLLDEMIDRFGEPPLGVLNLIAVAMLRIRATACGIADITQRADSLNFKLSRMEFSAVSELCASPVLKGRIRFLAGDVPIISYKLKKAEEPLKAAEAFVDLYQGMISA